MLRSASCRSRCESTDSGESCMSGLGVSLAAPSACAARMQSWVVAEGAVTSPSVMKEISEPRGCVCGVLPAQGPAHEQNTRRDLCADVDRTHRLLEIGASIVSQQQPTELIPHIPQVTTQTG